MTSHAHLTTHNDLRTTKSSIVTTKNDISGSSYVLIKFELNFNLIPNSNIIFVQRITLQSIFKFEICI